MIQRQLEAILKKRWNSGKILVVLGPRQVDKTTLLEGLCQQEGDYLFLNGDDIDTRTLLENAGEVRLRQLFGTHRTVFFDEAQRIHNVSLMIKLIHDRIKNVWVVVSGSSALDLSSSISEPLTGRKWEYKLFPISWHELVAYADFLGAMQQLETRLLFGMYPDVVNHIGD